MTPARTILIVAGEPSGDANAADLVRSLREQMPDAQFIGAGGPQMAAAGVQLSFNLTADATIGPVDALKNLGTIRQRQKALAELAMARRPQLIILVDFYSFNGSWIHTVKQAASPAWSPKIVQYTSPQVWASRPGRAEKMARDIDLLLCFFPFEKEWYARRGTPLRVEFVGHPIFDRHPTRPPEHITTEEQPIVVLLPGSRMDELRRHLPVMLAAAREIMAAHPARFKLVATDERSANYMRSFPVAGVPRIEIQTGEVAAALSSATIAITKTGTVSLECAYFGVPTIALYKTSTIFYWLARALVSVKYLSMPNILADEPVFPEFIQAEATPGNIARAALELLEHPARRAEVRGKLKRIIDGLGGPGCAKRAAKIIVETLQNA